MNPCWHCNYIALLSYLISLICSQTCPFSSDMVSCGPNLMRSSISILWCHKTNISTLIITLLIFIVRFVMTSKIFPTFIEQLLWKAFGNPNPSFVFKDCTIRRFVSAKRAFSNRYFFAVFC